MRKFILFDFDGVILDSYQTALTTQQIVCPDLDEEGYRRFFEGNIFERLNTGTIHSERCRHDDFWDHYIPKVKREGRLISGMDDAVRALAEEHALIIVSSGQTPFIEDFLVEHGLDVCFDRVMGNDVHESKEEKIRMVFKEYGADAADCVFVTDTLGDIREAAKMGVGTIGVTWGYHEAERLEQGNPFRLVETPEILPQSVADYFAERAAAA
jgi:phosphoglycolate phosphatase